MRGRAPGGPLLLGAGLVAILAASVASDDVRAARIASVPTAAPAIAASVDDSLGNMPEVSTAEDDGDASPATSNNVLPAPVPAASPSPALYTRIPKPALPPGPRRVGIQAGHWLTADAPPELWRLTTQTGTSWDGVTEVDLNLDIAKRIKAILEPKGIAVDVLPTTVPTGYVADAFVALHGDGDGTGENSGFKMAYSSRRTPFESDLLASIKKEYGAATGLAYDPEHISRAMLGYYAFTWQRYRSATYPLTPSVILEMGYVSNDNDRELLTEKPDVVAGAIANGIERFLDAHSRSELFGQDLLVPAIPQLRPATPTPSAAPTS